VRLLYLADIRFPLERANGVQTVETVWHLAERGHTVTLLVRPDTAYPARDPLHFFGLAPLATLTIRRARVGGSPAARRAQYLAAAVAAAMRPGRYDAVFTRDLGVASAILRLPRALRPPVVYESHGYAPDVRRQLPDLIPNARPASERQLKRLARREAHVWQRADGYVTITRALAADLSTRFGSRDRLIVAPDGARLPAAADAPSPNRAGEPTATYAGHLYVWKGVDILVAAAAFLPDVRIRIVGGMPGEPDQARLRAKAEALGAGARVEFVGYVPPPEVPAWLTRSDVLVLPNIETSVSARYTSPLKLFEYMAAGRPIVASRLPALEEVLADGLNALLVPPGDPSALAFAISRLVTEPGLAAALAARARHDVAEYSWARRAERLEELLRVAAGPGRRT
jgi:glycosyltransferase involved in cell wall biosynthesis